MAKGLVQNLLKQLRYALGCGRTHLLHQFVGVLVQELVDRLAQDIPCVHIVAHLETCILHCEINGQPFDIHVLDVILLDLLAIQLGDRTDIRWNRDQSSVDIRE